MEASLNATKKLIALILTLTCLFGLAGCKPDGTADLIELGEISAFVSEKGHTEEGLRERLVGEFNENVIHSWGEPDNRLSGFWGYGWYFDGDNCRYITLYFDADGYVEDIVIGNRLNEAVHITTPENEYYLGVIENSAFRVSVNGEGEYYTCSHKDDFLNKLLALQGR